MSSGVVLHHENWHFLTIPADTYFAQAHLCLMEGMLEHGNSKSRYADFTADCRRRIKNEMDLVEESDVKLFFVPGATYVDSRRVDDGTLGTNLILDQIKRSDEVDIAAHRMTYTRLFDAVTDRLTSGSNRLDSARMVVDDDVYFAGIRDEPWNTPNTSGEARILRQMADDGVDVGYMETNHSARLLHHNKYFIFYRNGEPYSVWTGAGNLTRTAFTSNYENFYYITIPEVVSDFADQYEHVWNDLATDYRDLPSRNILPR